MRAIRIEAPDSLVASSEEVALHAIREHFPCGDAVAPELKTCPCEKNQQVWLCICPECDGLLAFYISDFSDLCPHALELQRDLDPSS